MNEKRINKLEKKAAGLLINLRQAYNQFEETMELVPDQLTEQWRWNDDCFYSETLECYDLWEGLHREPSPGGLSYEVFIEQAEAAVTFIHEITKQIEDKLEEFVDIAVQPQAEYLINDRLEKNLECDYCHETLAAYRFRVDAILCPYCYWKEVYDG